MLARMLSDAPSPRFRGRRDLPQEPHHYILNHLKEWQPKQTKPLLLMLRPDTRHGDFATNQPTKDDDRSTPDKRRRPTTTDDDRQQPTTTDDDHQRPQSFAFQRSQENNTPTYSAEVQNRTNANANADSKCIATLASQIIIQDSSIAATAATIPRHAKKADRNITTRT